MNHRVKYTFLGSAPKPYYSLDDMRESSRKADYHFFDRETMRFFNSRVEEVTHVTAHTKTRVLFITSESYGRYDTEPPRFTVREFFPATGKVNTIGEFMQYSTLDAAKTAILDIFQEERRKSEGRAKKGSRICLTRFP